MMLFILFSLLNLAFSAFSLRFPRDAAISEPLRSLKSERVAYPATEGIRIYEPPPDGCEPIQVRLAIGDHPNELRVTWRTVDTHCTSAASYGPADSFLFSSSSSLSTSMRRVTGTSTSYTRDNLCNSPATDIDFGTIVTHSVVFADLEPNKLYLYSIDGSDGATTGSFLAPPTPSPDASFTFLTYADQGEPHDLDVTASPGGGVTGQYALYEVQSRGAALVFHMGDVAYANGESLVWDRYLSMIEGYARLVPYMVGPGNHETDYSLPSGSNSEQRDVSGTMYKDLPPWAQNEGSGGECGVPYGLRFTMPSSSSSASSSSSSSSSASSTLSSPPPPRSNPPFWYSFDYGSIHFFVLSSEHATYANSTQIEWLAEDLARVDRCRTPWVIGGMHRPLYVSKNGEDKDTAVLLRAELEPILIANGVNMMLYGHTHYYERGCPMQYGQCVADTKGGILHLAIGTGGHIPTSDGGFWEPWKQYAEDEYGYGRVVVQSSDKLTFEFIATADGLLHDSIDLRNWFHVKDQCSDRGGGEDRGGRGSPSSSSSSASFLMPSWLRLLYTWIQNIL